MIEVKFNGRLGNNMFQYSLGRLLAEQKQYQLYLNFSCNSNSGNTLLNLFKKSSDIVNGYTTDDNQVVIGYTSKSGYIQHFDIEELLRHNGKIVLNGFFQKHKFYFQHKNVIKNWFEYDSSNLRNLQQTDVVIHIRLTDYAELNYSVSAEKMYSMYKSLGFNSAVVITDDASSSLLNSFKKDSSVKIETNTLLQDFHHLIQAKNLILSHSTFGWWASFLGNQDRIYIPYTNDSTHFWKYHPDIDDIDLIPDTSKYVKINLS